MRFPPFLFWGYFLTTNYTNYTNFKLAALTGDRGQGTVNSEQGRMRVLRGKRPETRGFAKAKSILN